MINTIAKILFAGIPAAMVIATLVTHVKISPPSKAPTGWNARQAQKPSPAKKPQESEIDQMKRCAREARRERQRWFFDETGITTTLDQGSQAAEDYNNRLKALGLKTKTPLPFRDCSGGES